MSRWAAALLWLLSGYLAYIAISMAVLIISPMFREPWLGPEPEWLIPLVPLALAAALAWLGLRVWRRTPTIPS